MVYFSIELDEQHVKPININKSTFPGGKIVNKGAIDCLLKKSLIFLIIWQYLETNFLMDLFFMCMVLI